MKHVALSLAKWNNDIQFPTMPQATLEQVCNAVEQAPEVWSSEEFRVVIYAGLHSRGKRPKKADLRMAWKSTTQMPKEDCGIT